MGLLVFLFDALAEDWLYSDHVRFDSEKSVCANTRTHLATLTGRQNLADG